MINQQILKNGGAEPSTVSSLVSAWKAYQDAKDQPLNKVPHIVCTGIYNAGKSTLLNVLLDTEQFPTGDIPTTKKVAQAEYGGAVYVDTPGLNATEADDQETANAYREADVYLFVANAQNGGVGEQESEWLRELKERHADKTALKRKLVYVLSQCDQLEPETVEKVRAKTSDDLQSVLGMRPDKIFCVDAHTYRDGKAQSETLLVESSGIPALRDFLQSKTQEAEKSLANDHAKELHLRQEVVLDQLNQMKKKMEQLHQKASDETAREINTIEQIWNELSDELDSVMPQANDEYFISEYPSFYIKSSCRLHESSKSAIKREIEYELDDSMETEWEKEVSRKVNEAKKYCREGMDNIYFSKCERINRIFEKYISNFQRAGVSVTRAKEISVKPEFESWFEDNIESILRSKSSMHSASYYVDRYADKDIYDWIVTRNGLFGRTVNITEYKCGGYSSVAWKAKEDMEKDMKSNARRVNSEIGKYWRSYCKSVNMELDTQKNAIKKQLDDYLGQLKEKALQSPTQDALTYIKKLTKEVQS